DAPAALEGPQVAAAQSEDEEDGGGDEEDGGAGRWSPEEPGEAPGLLGGRGSAGGRNRRRDGDRARGTERRHCRRRLGFRLPLRQSRVSIHERVFTAEFAEDCAEDAERLSASLCCPRRPLR